MLGGLISYVRRHHVGLLALLVAMTGTAYAAGSINGRDIVNGSVKGKDLKNRSIQGRDIEVGSLKGVHIDETTLDSNLLSASVALNAGGFAELISGEGFDDVEEIESGIYQLTTAPGEAVGECDYGTAFLSGDIGADNQVVAATVSELGDDLLVQVRAPNGRPIPLGGASGVEGFSVLANCLSR